MAVIRNGSTVVGEVFEHSNFAICSTTASTQVKAVSCPLYKPYVGARISIKFTHGSTVGTCVGTDSNVIDPITAPKISINGGTAYPIYVGGEPAGENFCASGDVHDFVFDGERFNDITATVIYKGGDDTSGYYEKARNGNIEQNGIAKSNTSTAVTVTYPIHLTSVFCINLESITPYAGTSHATLNSYSITSCTIADGQNGMSANVLRSNCFWNVIGK